MNRPDTKSNDPRRVEDRPRVQEQTSEIRRKEGTVTRFVDPYDMRPEAQPEEPGYGHGV
jgi:hypothetical protein